MGSGMAGRLLQAGLLTTQVERTSRRGIYAAIRKRHCDAARRCMAGHLVDARGLPAMAAEKQAQRRLKQDIGALSGKGRRTA
jgi:DNA-binding FadR family transcriptional regulator